MIVVLSRKELLGQAFIAAGDRGLTGPQMEVEVGTNWRRRLKDLKADGWMFREDPRRFGRPGTFRWICTYVPLAQDAAEQRGPEQLALLDAGVGVAPASALEAA